MSWWLAVAQQQRNVIDYTPEIGEYYEGGYVAHIFTPEEKLLAGFTDSKTHGIIACEPQDQFTSQWGCQGTLIGGIGIDGDIGKGKEDTQKIVDFHEGWQSPYEDSTQNGIDAVCHIDNDGTVAAVGCVNLTLRGYSDWILPAMQELMKVYDNLHEPGLVTYNTGRTWTTAEFTRDMGRKVRFSDRSRASRLKSMAYMVIPIRYF